jgi:hypothetical protein
MYALYVISPDNSTPRKVEAWHPSVKGVSLTVINAVLKDYRNSWPNNSYWVETV